MVLTPGLFLLPHVLHLHQKPSVDGGSDLGSQAHEHILQVRCVALLLIVTLYH